MSVHDESRYPWLRDEKRLLETLVETDTPVLGIGLGCRLLAQVLGGAVESVPAREVGWFPVHRTSGASPGTPTGTWPDRMTALHWHTEIFEVPEGGRLLARGETDVPEAFGWNGRVVGLQFHLEVTARGVERLLYNPPVDLLNGGGDRVQNPEDIRAGTDHLEELHPRLFDLLDRLDQGGGE